MKQRLDDNQIKILGDLKEIFLKDNKNNFSIVLNFIYSAALCLLTQLPFFLGKGKLKYHSITRNGKISKKPLLVLFHNPHSLLTFKMLYSQHVKMEHKPYTTYVVPTALGKFKTQYDYDVILAGTHYYPSFLEQKLMGVVVFESNYIEEDVIKKYTLTFQQYTHRFD